MQSGKLMRWRGTPDHLAQVGRLLLKEYKERVGEDAPVSLQLQTGDSTTEYQDVAEFAADIDPNEWKGLDRIFLSVGLSPTTPRISATVVFSRSEADPAVGFTVQGHDKVEVNGLAAVVEQALSKGRQVAIPPWVLLASIMLLIAALQALIYILPIPSVPGPPFVVILLFGIAGGVVFFGAVKSFVGGVNWLMPKLELLNAGEQPRWERSKRWVVTGVGGVVLVPLGLNLLTAYLTAE